MREIARGTGVCATAVLLALLVTAGLFSGSAAFAASERSTEALAALESDFRTLPIEGGWVLQPLDDGLGIRAIEVKQDALAIDGQRISKDELEARLGDLAPAILALSDASSEAEAEASPDETQDREIARAEERERERASRRSRHQDRLDSQVVVGNDIAVEEDDIYRDIVVFGGRLTVAGQVIGDAVSIGGSADVSGEITGDLVAVGGSIDLSEGARVMGDVVSVGGTVTRAEGVEVIGQVVEVPFGPNFDFGNFRGSWGNWGNWGNWNLSDEAHDWGRHARWFGFFEAGWELIGLLFCVLLACLVLLIARNPVERIAAKVAEEPWKAGLVGLLTQILCVPVLVLVCVVLLISIIGIPLLLLVPFAILGFILVAFLGFTSVAYWLGGWAEERFGWRLANPYFSLGLGVVLIEVLALIGEFLGLGPGPIKFFAAMFVIAGALVSYLAWTVGLGAAVLTRFGTWGETRGAIAPPPPPPGDSLPPAPDWSEPDEAALGGQVPEGEVQSERL